MWDLWQGRAEALPLPSDSVDLVVTSPPYELCRLYLEDGSDLGIARDTESWVAFMVTVVRECVRVCRGLCVFVVEGQTRDYRYSCGPALLMADLHRAGFNLRKPPIYRRVGIPGSGGPDWWRNDWEWCLCVSRPGRLPWSDNTATGHEPIYPPGGKISHRLPNGQRVNGGKTRRDKRRVENGIKRELQGYIPPALANPGNVIDCNVGGGRMGDGDTFAIKNEAPFSEALVEPFILSFCQPGGVVLDPFAGSGTTGAVAVRHGRRFLGCDLRLSQVALSERRLSQETPMELFNDP